MSAVDASSFDAALKEFYSAEGINDVTYPENPWFALCPKKTDAGGKRYVQPIQYGIPNGRSRTFSTAQANKSTNKYEDFFVTYADNFGVISITRKVMKQSAGAGKKAFFEARQREVDGMLDKLIRGEAISMYRGSGGSIGQISAGYTSGTTFTLNDIEEISNFEVGDVLVFSANDGDTASDTLIGGGTPTTATVTGVDRDAGTVTVNDATGLAASRYLFIEGDFQNSIAGLLAWIPTTAPTSGDSFFGVDRSSDSRLYGSRVTATNVSIAEAIRIGIARLGREGASPDLCLMNHLKFRDLQLELGNKVVYNDLKSTDARIGFKSIMFTGSRSKNVDCVADQNCLDDNIFLLTKDTWKLVSLGPVPDMVDDDGVTMLREVSAAGYEVRADSYCNLSCDDPRANCVITVESD
jgi:hypothetical protein